MQVVACSEHVAAKAATPNWPKVGCDLMGAATTITRLTIKRVVALAILMVIGIINLDILSFSLRVRKSTLLQLLLLLLLQQQQLLLLLLILVLAISVVCSSGIQQQYLAAAAGRGVVVVLLLL